MRSLGALLLLGAMLAVSACVPRTDVAQGPRAEPYARSWADPSWPRPDQPPDRDGRGLD